MLAKRLSPSKKRSRLPRKPRKRRKNAELRKSNGQKRTRGDGSRQQRQRKRKLKPPQKLLYLQARREKREGLWDPHLWLPTGELQEMEATVNLSNNRSRSIETDSSSSSHNSRHNSNNNTQNLGAHQAGDSPGLMLDKWNLTNLWVPRLLGQLDPRPVVSVVYLLIRFLLVLRQLHPLVSLDQRLRVLPSDRLVLLSAKVTRLPRGAELAPPLQRRRQQQ